MSNPCESGILSQRKLSETKLVKIPFTQGLLSFTPRVNKTSGSSFAELDPLSAVSGLSVRMDSIQAVPVPGSGGY